MAEHMWRELWSDIILLAWFRITTLEYWLKNKEVNSAANQQMAPSCGNVTTFEHDLARVLSPF
jgi:hypothetical protein